MFKVTEANTAYDHETDTHSKERSGMRPLPCQPTRQSSDARFNTLPRKPSSLQTMQQSRSALPGECTSTAAKLADFMKVRKQTSVAVLNHTDGEYQRTSCKNKPSRTAEFDSMCAKLEENFSPEGPDGTTAAESLKLNKKLVGTLLAKSFEQELVGNADLKKPIDTLSVRMQTLASLFILPEKEDQAKKQETIIRGFFDEDIKFTHDSKNTGAYNPENDGDAFYQYRNYAYDKSGNEGKIIGNKPGDRNFLNNSHPFYALSLIMNLHYVGHEVPMVGESNKGVKQNTSTIAKILTVPFIKHHLFKTNYGARDSRMEPHASVAKDVFGTFTAPNEITLAEAMGLSTKEAPSEFFQETGWKSVKSSYKPKSGNAYNENATKKDYYVAGASGATVGILCAHVRLASFEKYLQNDGHVVSSPVKLTF